jgi:KRAB domain-containing zinc finger protein
MLQEGKVRPWYLCKRCNKRYSRKDMAGHVCTDSEGNLSCLTLTPKGNVLTLADKPLLFFADRSIKLCPLCGDRFTTPINLDVHMLNKHGMMSERHSRHSCPLCPKVFARKSGLDSHTVRAHGTGVFGDFVCDFCGRKFRSKNSLYAHRTRTHIGKRWQCEYCSESFGKKYLWRIHTQRHLGNRQFVCSVCNKDFASNYSLDTHRRIHTGERPFPCPAAGCERAFIQRAGLQEHMQRKHPHLPAPSIQELRALVARKSAKINSTGVGAVVEASSREACSNVGANASSACEDEETNSASANIPGFVSL